MEQQVKWLLAWLNEDEAMSALLGRAPAPNEDLTSLRRKRQDAKTALMRRHPHQQSTPVLEKIPRGLKERAAAFQQRPDVNAALHGLAWTLGLIDLRHLLTLQKAVIHEDAGPRAEALVADDPDSLFSFCLPDLGMDGKVSGTIDKVNKAITLSSRNRKSPHWQCLDL